ncbi:MAG: aspartate--tRNA(Asn) ligase, partial [Lachnospiraceae bacterium]|nr:aspartate--tRNA(Asn) ligase [Lachnospiraceae bacterium]
MNKITGTVIPATFTAEEIKGYAGETVKLRGSIYKIRKMSDFAFVLLRTGREVLQCVYEQRYADFSLEILKEESCVILTAEVVLEERSKTGYDLRLKEAEILSVPYRESPIVINQKLVDTSIENLLDYRPVTLRNSSQRAVFKLQEGIANAFRTFLLGESFTEIHTPKIVQAGAEGGANIFKLDYFGKQAYLAQSPQFYKQMMVGVFERVFEIAPVFRAEKHDTKRHLNEYTGVDFEMGYINSFADIMQMETKMLRFSLEYLKEYYENELELLRVKLPVIDDIPSISFDEAKEMVANARHRRSHEAKDFEPEEERLL